MAFWGKRDDDESKNKQTDSPLNSTDTQKTPIPDAPTAPLAAKSEGPAETPVKNDPYGKVRSALGPGTIIQGKLSFDTVVSIDGKLGGEIFSSKALLVGPSGIVDAQIDVQVLIVKGIVRGVVRASERVELREGGQILGDVITPVLVMDEGCIFNGSCSMEGQSRAASAGTKKPFEKKEVADTKAIPPTSISAESEQIPIV